MRLKFDFEIPNWTKWVVGACAAGLVLGAGAIGLAEVVSVPNKFENGMMLSADSLNENFKVLENGLNEASPPGAVTAFAGVNAPKGWLLCNGDAVSRTQYPALFATIGDTYGAGDSATTFNLPDLRAAVVRGVGTSTKFVSNTRIQLGELVNDQMQGHTHLDQGHSHQKGAVNLGLFVPRGDFYGNYMNPSDTEVGRAKLGPPSTDQTNGTPRVGAETTVKAVGLNYIIKY